MSAVAERLYPKATAQGQIAPDELMKLRRHLEQRLAGLHVDRMSWWTHWREIADYLIPRRYKWLITPNQASRGSPINNRIIDNTATRALRTLAAGMMSGVTSPSRPWFKLMLADQELSQYQPVKEWLDEVTKRMSVVFAESNFYTSLGTVYEDLGGFGTAAMIVYEDFEDVIRCYNSCAGEYFLGNSDRLAVDTLYRQFVLTVAQLVRRYGAENCSLDVRNAASQGGASLSREHIVAHAIEPNDTMVEGVRGFKGMAYREVYWEWGKGGAEERGVLSRKGFHECPFIAPRWSIVGNDAYGRGPGMEALGDIKQLQVEQKRKAQAIDKMVNPPMVADISMRNQPASLISGAITYTTNNTAGGGVGFKPAFEVKPDLQHMLPDIKECQDRIGDTFFVPLFMMISQLETVRSATEIDARKEEKLILLGPVLERFFGEGLDPVVDRTFNIMWRAKLLPTPPAELRGQHIKTEYISMLAQAQRAATTAALERFSAFTGRLASVNPGVLDKVDMDELCDEYAEMVGAPAKVVRAAADVAKMRAARAKQQQQQAIMEQTLPAVQAAKTLSETDVGGGKSALAAMMGGPAGDGGGGMIGSVR